MPMTDEAIDWAELSRRHANGDIEYQIVETIKAGTRAARALSHPLDRYLANGSIDQRQYDAGFQLYKDWQFSQIRSSYAAMDGTPAPTSYFGRSVTDRQLEARDAHQNALLAVGHRLSLSLTDIIINEMTLEQHAGRLECSTRTAKRRFKLALDSLADHYGALVA